jgi:beta-glucosidase
MRLITNSLLAMGICIPLVLAVAQEPGERQPQLGSRGVPLITVDGLRFRDLNRDGKLEPYEDWRLPAQQRADDLAGRMSLEEKAGLMMHASAPAKGSPEIGRGTEYDLDKAGEMISAKKVTTFITRLTGPAAAFAGQNNLLQELAERTRFAIPLTISTDPRNNFKTTLGASNDAGGFSQWPDMTGMAAIGRPDVTRKFGDIARQEYLSVGIQMALSPQADLSTEPRWSRMDGTFGEDPQMVKTMVEAYVAGFQDGETGLHPGSVACVVKHWVGYGAMKGGLDAHNSYSRHAVFSGDAFEQHLVPFEGAFAAGVAAVMPTYAILDGVNLNGKPLEAVAAGFNKQLLTELLREKYHFDGVILSDWLITESCRGECLQGAAAGVTPSIAPGAFGMPWGVENLTVEQRYAKALDAGIDQFGGVADSNVIVKLVREGKVPAARIDESARRLLRQKFDLGLFENPFVDTAKAGRTAGQAEFKQAALKAQERSMVLLTNEKLQLPERRRKVFLAGVSSAAATAAGLTPVATMGEAEFAVVRLSAPHQNLHPGYFFGSRQHEGDLDFKTGDPQLIEFQKVAKQLPTVAVVYLDRPAIVTPVVEQASAVLVDFGASDEAVLAVIQGKAAPEGTLPFELPKTMDAVRAQRPDLSHDSLAPEFPIHFGLSYQGETSK